MNPEVYIHVYMCIHTHVNRQFIYMYQYDNGCIVCLLYGHVLGIWASTTDDGSHSSWILLCCERWVQ